jgi:hypothetical protein
MTLTLALTAIKARLASLSLAIETAEEHLERASNTGAHRDVERWGGELERLIRERDELNAAVELHDRL